MTGYCWIFSFRAPSSAPSPATPGAVTVRSVDPRVGSAEGASERSVTPRIEPRVGWRGRAFVCVCRSSRPQPGNRRHGVFLCFPVLGFQSDFIE